MPGPYNKFNISIHHDDVYTLTDEDHASMIRKDLVPGNDADELSYMIRFMTTFPDVFIGKFMMRETAHNRERKFPDSSVTIQKDVV